MADLLISVSDTVIVTTAFLPSLGEDLTVTDVSTLMMPLYIACNEAITVTDPPPALSGLSVPTGPAPNKSEAITVSESVTGSLLADNPFRQAAVANATQVTLSRTTLLRNALAVFVRWGSASITLDSVTDSNGNSYTLVQNPITLASGVRAAAAVAIDQVGGASLTIFGNFSSTPSNVWMAAHEVTQRDLLAPVDGSAGQAQNTLPVGTDAVSSTAFTPTRDGAYIFGGSTESGAGVVTDPGTGFLMRTRDLPVSVGFITEDTIQTTAAAVSATFTGQSPGQAYASIGLALAYARAWLPTIAETVTVTESVTVTLGPQTVIGDSITVTEDVTVRLNVLQLPVSEAIAVTEQITLNIASFPGLAVSVFDLVLLEGPPPPAPSQSDAVVVSDVVLLVLSGVIVADTVTVVENLTVRMTVRITVFDEVLLVLMAESFEAVTVSENVGITFATAGARQVAVNDALIITELVASLFHPERAVVSDAVTVTDSSQLAITPLQVSSSSSVAITDQPSTALITNIAASVFEAVAVTENTQIAFKTAATLVPVVSDSLDVTESVSLLTGPNASVAESVTVTESVTIAVVQLKLSVTEDVTVTDSSSLSVSTLGGINVSDGVAVTESVAGNMSLLEIVMFDAVSVGEGRDLTENPMRLEVFELVGINDDESTARLGAAAPSPRIRGMFAWERWIRRGT